MYYIQGMINIKVYEGKILVIIYIISYKYYLIILKYLRIRIWI